MGRAIGFHADRSTAAVWGRDNGDTINGSSCDITVLGRDRRQEVEISQMGSECWWGAVI